jgi:hypothetical protein
MTSTTRQAGIVDDVGDMPSTVLAGRTAQGTTASVVRRGRRLGRWPDDARCEITLYLTNGKASCTVRPPDCTTAADAAMYVHAFAGALRGSARAVLVEADGQLLGEVAFEQYPGAAPPAHVDPRARDDQSGNLSAENGPARNGHGRAGQRSSAGSTIRGSDPTRHDSPIRVSVAS